MNNEQELINAVKLRYDKESAENSTLSCGNNLNYLELKIGESILDIGCGKGLETIEAVKLIGGSGRAVGLDITPKMLDIAVKNAKINNITNIDFITGDIEDLPFENRSFDAVMSNCVINHAKNKLRVYKEIYRVLKEEGRFVVSDAVTKYPLPNSIKDDPEQWAQCFGGAVTEDEYFSAIKDAGFKELHIIKRREYLKNGYDFISLTIKAFK